MSDRVLLVLPNALEASAIRAALDGSPDIAVDVECVFRCSDGLQRLQDDRQNAIAAVVLDLFLPDSQGIETLKAFLRVRPLVPILVVSRTQDESTAIQAVQQGAQDYLLLERVDAYSLQKALRGMLTRSSRTRGSRSGCNARASHAGRDWRCDRYDRRRRQRDLSESRRRIHDGLVTARGSRATVGPGTADHRRGDP